MPFLRNGNHLSNRKPALKSTAASTKARALPGRMNERKIPAPKVSVKIPTVCLKLLFFRNTLTIPSCSIEVYDARVAVDTEILCVTALNYKYRAFFE